MQHSLCGVSEDRQSLSLSTLHLQLSLQTSCITLDIWPGAINQHTHTDTHSEDGSSAGVHLNAIHSKDQTCCATGPSVLLQDFFLIINVQVKRSCTGAGGDLQCESDLGEKRLCLKSLGCVFKLAGSKGIKIDVGAFFHWLHTAQPNDGRLRAGWADTDLVLVFILRLRSVRPRSWQRGAQRVRWGVPTEGWFCDKQSVVLVVLSLAELTSPTLMTSIKKTGAAWRHLVFLYTLALEDAWTARLSWKLVVSRGK